MARLDPGSIRFRLTAIATIVVAIVLVATAVALLAVQRRQLTATLDGSLEQRADTVEATFTNAVTATPLNTNDEDRAIQLVADDGTILAATTNLAGHGPLPNTIATGESQTIQTRSDLPLEDDAYRVLTRRIDTDRGPALLHVAENSDDLSDAIRGLSIALALTVPAVVAVLAGVMWWLTGRALDPVETIRADVEAITSTNSSQRINGPDRDDEIGRLARTMNRMLDRLRDATQRHERFVADAAHELRTPLTRIRTEVDVDLARPDQADPIETIRAIRSETVGLQHLIDDLLHLARHDAGTATSRRRPVDLDDVVMDEIRQMRTVSDGVVIDAGSVSAAHLVGNADHLRRAVRNVLDNAVRHAQSAVTVTLVEDDGRIELSVSDDGPGVPEQDRSRIFERFARVDSSRNTDDGGTGLGLAITHDILIDHGGTIRYDDSWTGGARFVVELPTR